MTFFIDKLITGHKYWFTDMSDLGMDFSSWFDCLPFMEKAGNYSAFDI
jgi:hypothetical protein